MGWAQIHNWHICRLWSYLKSEREKKTDLFHYWFCRKIFLFSILSLRIPCIVYSVNMTAIFNMNEDNVEGKLHIDWRRNTQKNLMNFENAFFKIVEMVEINFSLNTNWYLHLKQTFSIFYQFSLFILFKVLSKKKEYDWCWNKKFI